MDLLENDISVDMLHEQMGELNVADTQIKLDAKTWHTFENEVVIAVSPFYCITWCSTDGLMYAYRVSTVLPTPSQRTLLKYSQGFSPDFLPMMSIFYDIEKGPAVVSVVYQDGVVRVWDMDTGKIVYDTDVSPIECSVEDERDLIMTSAILLTSQWVIIAIVMPTEGHTKLWFGPWLAHSQKYSEEIGQKQFSITPKLWRIDALTVSSVAHGLVYIGTCSGMFYIDMTQPIASIAVVQCTEEALEAKWPFGIEEHINAFAYHRECHKFHALPAQEKLQVRQQQRDVTPCDAVNALNARECKPCNPNDLIVGIHTTENITSILTVTETIFINKKTKCILPIAIDSALAVCSTRNGICFILNADLQVIAVDAFSKSNKPDVTSIFIEDGHLVWKYTEVKAPQLTICETELDASVWVHGYTNALFLVGGYPVE